MTFFLSRGVVARVLTSFALTLSLAAGAAGATLTFDDAQRVAAERSRQLVAHDAAIQASREMAVAAGQLPDPVLRAGIDNLPIEGSDRLSLSRDFMTMRRIGVMQEFTAPEKRRLRAQRFDREADRFSAERNATLATIQRDTAIAWLETFYLERLRSAVVQQLEESRREIEAVEGAYRGARASQADVINARSARTLVEDRLSELDRRIRNARTMLSRWIGDEPARSQLVGEPRVDSTPPHIAFVEQELERHPNIAVVTQEIAMAETEAALARANRRSDLTWELAYQNRGSAFSDMVSVGVSIPLPWNQKNLQGREIAAKLALAEKARAQRDEMLRQHVAEVRAMANEWENGRERLARYHRELIPLARNRSEALVASYRGGKSDLASVIAARRSEVEVQAQALQLEIDTARVWAQLRYLFPDGSAPAVHPASAGPEVRK